jgi:hypothetical protein
VGVIGGGVIAAFILSKFGLLGSLLGLAATAGGVYLIFKRQDKYGLRQDQKLQSDIHFPKRFNNKKLLQNGKNKKQAFDIPFIGYDYGKDFIGILMFFSGSMEILLSVSK